MLIGISMVRNEADIVARCVEHHLVNEGCDRILVTDDGSTDGTFEILRRLQGDRLYVTRHKGGFRQRDVLSKLAAQAYDMGARWILPFDADEFWHAPGGVHDALRKIGDVAAVRVDVVNFVQHRTIHAAATANLATVRHRVTPVGAQSDGPAFAESGRCSYVECVYPPKFVHRAAPDLVIADGNHETAAEHVATDTPIQCLHLPLRARGTLEAKVAQSRRLDEEGFPPDHGWHVRRFAAVAARDGLDAEWAANSEFDGRLDAARGKVQLVYDPTIADLTANLRGTREDTARRRLLDRPLHLARAQIARLFGRNSG